MLRAAVALLLTLVLSGCGAEAGVDGAGTGISPTPTSSDPSSSQEASQEPAGGAVPALLDFTGTTVTGERFDGASLAGKPTVLWFWAPWCPTCRGQIPQVEQLATDHGGDVNVIGVGSLDSAEAIAEFAGDVEGVTHLEDVEGELWKRFEVTEQSSFVVLDADGSVTFEAGYGGSDALEAEVESLLG